MTKKCFVVVVLTAVIIVCVGLVIWSESVPQLPFTMDMSISNGLIGTALNRSFNGRMYNKNIKIDSKETIASNIYMFGDGIFGELPSGFDSNAKNIFNNVVANLSNLIFDSPDKAIQTIDITPFKAFHTVIHSEGPAIPNWWQSEVSDVTIKWEKTTFEIFFRYIDSNTILIDFGTWIGPTVLYGVQFASQVYGIEGDPAALAEVLINIKLNADQSWYKDIHIQPGCVSTKNDSGIITMRSGRPGNSCSGIGKNIACVGNQKIVSWNVQCYDLIYLLGHWNVSNYWQNGKKMFIKIDIESYECKLIPDLYEWLLKIPNIYLPTFYISYHPHISKCTQQEYMGFTKIIKLYDEVICGELRTSIKLIIQDNTTLNNIEIYVQKCLTIAPFSFVLYV